ATLYADNATFTNLTIQNNIFSGGWSGVWISCISNDYATGTKINNNTFSEHKAESIFIRYHDAPEVNGNYIDNSEGYNYFRIFLYNCSNDLTVLKNIVKDDEYGGIVLSYCDGNTAKIGLVANNFVDIGGTTEAYGIHTTHSDYQRIYNNSVRITSTHTTNGRAYYNYNGDDIDVQNNIFSNFGGGYAYYTNSISAITTSDYNDLFATGNNVGYWNGARTDLAAFQAASSTDANSLSVNPVFISATDLHVTSSYIDSAGTYLALVTDDIDGEARDATYPDIGADEFTPTEFPLAGEFTIGGITPNYETFTAAVEDLNNLGIKGTITFNVRSGTYTEQIELLEIAGASTTDTIVFQSESGDSTDVRLTINAQSSEENY
ncbi:MAG: right-handed parallel beta-helix repeat-containing protein, partial [Candidatus Cloacimonetes bacterium]|nr:right-handed parallel beta-helix repeat-containing protein [Candidatus Cloacimonadota bacterium]